MIEVAKTYLRALKQRLLQTSIKERVMASVIIVVILIGIGYWQYSQRYVSTEDAYLNANVIQVAARVTGQVAQLYVVNNQFVQKGQRLFDLDVQPFEVAVAKAKAQLARANADWQAANMTANRTLKLVKSRYLPPQSADDVQAKLQAAVANVQLATANLLQANLDLQYAHVQAPASGWLSNLTLQVGNNIEANQPLFALISNVEYWVDANFKETELAKIRPGQPATVELDMYPDVVFKGRVESISSGSGTVFSLLPPQNATGNWVKITQRVPVRVKILSVDSRYPLRIGTTATVTINTR